jgi:hypothetical protein
MDLESTIGDTIPATRPCEECARLDLRLALAAQTIEQLQHEIASLRAVLLRPLPDGM